MYLFLHVSTVTITTHAILDIPFGYCAIVEVSDGPLRVDLHCVVVAFAVRRGTIVVS